MEHDHLVIRRLLGLPEFGEGPCPRPVKGRTWVANFLRARGDCVSVVVSSRLSPKELGLSEARQMEYAFNLARSWGIKFTAPLQLVEVVCHE